MLVADLFSLYISFYPKKSKNSAEVANCFRTYFAAQGIPKSINTDPDQSFRGDTETLLRTYGIRHITSYPYTQKEARVYTGTHRIIGLDNRGARIKNVKTGDETSVCYEHIRKINLEDLLALLPQNFDAEIMGALDTYRYKSAGKGDKDEPDGTSKDGKNEDENGKRKKEGFDQLDSIG